MNVEFSGRTDQEGKKERLQPTQRHKVQRHKAVQILMLMVKDHQRVKEHELLQHLLKDDWAEAIPEIPGVRLIQFLDTS